MRLDAALAFVPLGSPLSLIGAAGTTFYSNTIDLLGVGVGNAPPSIIGNTSLYGSVDGVGIGSNRLELAIATGSADFVVGGGSPTLNVQLQGSADTANTYQPAGWYTFGESGALAAALLLKNTVISRLPFLPPWPFKDRPRYLRLAFVTPAGGAFSTGSIAYAIPTPARDDYTVAYAANNYVVA